MTSGEVSGMRNACGRGKRTASRSWSGLTSECRGGVNTGNKVSSCTTERIEDSCRRMTTRSRCPRRHSTRRIWALTLRHEGADWWETVRMWRFPATAEPKHVNVKNTNARRQQTCNSLAATKTAPRLIMIFGHETQTWIFRTKMCRQGGQWHQSREPSASDTTDLSGRRQSRRQSKSGQRCESFSRPDLCTFLGSKERNYIFDRRRSSTQLLCSEKTGCKGRRIQGRGNARTWYETDQSVPSHQHQCLAEGYRLS